MSKVCSIKEAAALVSDGDRLALGGNLLQRVPGAFVRELARGGKRGLKVMKTAANYDIDLLCLTGCVDEVIAGFVSFEAEFGLAPNFRRSVKERKVTYNENSCYTVIASMRAAAFGVPFMPVAELGESHITKKFKRTENPYGEGSVLTIPAIYPDWAVLHVQESDEDGNAVIYGPVFEDIIMSRAARRIILTCERVVANDELAIDLAVIPAFKVDAVVELPGGASPGSCRPYYGYSPEKVSEYLALKTPEDLAEYLDANNP